MPKHTLQDIFRSIPPKHTPLSSIPARECQKKHSKPGAKRQWTTCLQIPCGIDSTSCVWAGPLRKTSKYVKMIINISFYCFFSMFRAVLQNTPGICSTFVGLQETDVDQRGRVSFDRCQRMICVGACNPEYPK